MRERSRNTGQAMVVLLFVTAIVVSLIVQMSVLSLSSVKLDNEYSQGVALLSRAEGYLENGAIRYLRDPDYPGETINEGNVSCQIETADIAGGKDISCTCQEGSRSRTVGLTVTFSDGVFTFSPVEERE